MYGEKPAEADAGEEGAEHYHDSGKCPHCGSGNIVTDRRSGERVCGSCAVVLDEVMVDPGQEWRSFNLREDEDRSRTAPGKDVLNRSTWTSFRMGDVKGIEQSHQFRRMRRESTRAASGSGMQRNLHVAKDRFDVMCGRLGHKGSDNAVRSEASNVYLRALKAGLVRGRSIDGMVAASIKVAWRRMGVSRPMSDVADASGVDKKEIGKNYRLMVKELGMRIGAPKAKEALGKIVNVLDAPPRHERLAGMILDEAKALRILDGKSPEGAAAGAYYIASKYLGGTRTQADIAKAARTTEVTVRNRYKALRDGLAEQGVLVSDLAERAGFASAAKPELPDVPELASQQPGPETLVEGIYLQKLDELSRDLCMSATAYGAAQSIYGAALRSLRRARDNRQLALYASAVLALELYGGMLRPEDAVSPATSSNRREVRRMARAIRRSLDLEEPDVSMEECARYVLGKMKADDGAVEKVVLGMLAEYERDAAKGLALAADRMSLAAAAAKKVLKHFGMPATSASLGYRCGLTVREVSAGLKALAGYSASEMNLTYGRAPG